MSVKILVYSLPSKILKYFSVGEDPSYKKQRSIGGADSVLHEELLQFLIFILLRDLVKFSISVKVLTELFEKALLQDVSALPPPL